MVNLGYSWVLFEVHVPDGLPLMKGVGMLYCESSNQKILYMMSIPCGFGIFPGFSVCLSLSSDLYMPKWQPDGDVIVCSGHFQKPAIRGSNLRGFIICTGG